MWQRFNKSDLNQHFSSGFEDSTVYLCTNWRGGFPPSCRASFRRYKELILISAAGHWRDVAISDVIPGSALAQTMAALPSLKEIEADKRRELVELFLSQTLTPAKYAKLRYDGHGEYLVQEIEQALWNVKLIRQFQIEELWPIDRLHEAVAFVRSGFAILSTRSASKNWIVV